MLRTSAIALFAATFVLYWVSLSPGVVGGDSGELLAAACSQAAPHPPGYPVYILLAKVFLWLPWGSAAQRLNLFSAAANAAAVGLLALSMGRLSRSLPVGMLAGLSFACLDLSWRFATSTDVFALNNFFVACLMWLTSWASPSPQQALMIWGLGGLALCNHQTVLFYLPAVFLVSAWRLRALQRPRLAGGLLAAFIAGLLPYALLPYLFDSSSPWGWGDLTRWTGVLRHILRSDYGTFNLSSAPLAASSGHFWGLWGLWFGDLWRGSLLVVPAGLGALGLCWGRLNKPLRAYIVLWGGNALLYGTVFFYLADLPIDVPVHVEMQSRFWLQLHLVLCGLSALGFGAVFKRLRVGASGQWAGVGALALALLASNWQSGSGAGANLFELSGRATLASLPPRAIVLTRGEHVFNPLRYLQACEKMRPDITVLSVEMMHAPWYRQKALRGDPQLIYPGSLLLEQAKVRPPAFGLDEFLQANLRTNRPLFQCDHLPILGAAQRLRYRLYQSGLCQQIVEQPRGWRPYIDSSLAIFKQLEKAMLQPVRQRSWEEVMRQQIARSEEGLAPQILLAYGQTASQSAQPTQTTERLRQSIALYEHAAQVLCLTPASTKNLGIAYYRLFAATGELAAKTKMRQTFARWLQDQQHAAPAQLEPPAARQAVIQLLETLEG